MIHLPFACIIIGEQVSATHYVESGLQICYGFEDSFLNFKMYKLINYTTEPKVGSRLSDSVAAV